MNTKRILTILIGLPIVILVLVLGNKYLIDALMAVVAIVALNECFKCVSKEAKPIKWLRIFACIGNSIYSYNRL